MSFVSVLDAARVLGVGHYEFVGNRYDVTATNTNPDTADDHTDRTVIVTGVKEPLIVEVLELWLEKKTNGRGPLVSTSGDGQNGVVTAVFEDSVCTYYCMSFEATIELFNCHSII